MKTKTLLLLCALILVLAACAQGSTELKAPEIRYGEDVCADCNMIISDPRFAAAYAHELSPGRYQSALFDDIADMLIYADKHPEHKVAAWYVHDYETKEWTDATLASYVVSEQFETPMASGFVAFARHDRGDAMAYALHTTVLDWNTLRQQFKAGDLGQGMMGGNVPMSEHDLMPGQEITLGETAVKGYQVQLMAHAPLHAGYNTTMVHLTGPDGQPVSGAQVMLTPTMDMLDGKHHGSGVEPMQPEMPGMYHGALIFSMPGGADVGSWSVTATFTDTIGGVNGSAAFPVDVTPSKLHGSFMGPDEEKIFLSVIQPITPTVGKQPFEIFAMQKRGMFDWPALDDLTLEITPWMPTMDHGSFDNIHPTSQGGGHYLGTVNFSMNGLWTITALAKRGESVLGKVVFEYEVVVK